jgi:hypothetical protein
MIEFYDLKAAPEDPELNPTENCLVNLRDKKTDVNFLSYSGS